MKASPFLLHLTELLKQKTGNDLVIKKVGPEYGGSINESYKLESSNGDFFLKRSPIGKFPDMYNAEKKGLQLLKTHSSFKIPEVLFTGTVLQYDFLIMEYVHKSNRENPGFRNDFGVTLANMHRNEFDCYGLDHNNYIGSLVQTNSLSNNWSDFFAGQRLVPMVSMAHQNKKIDLDTVKRFEKLCFKLNELFPPSFPSLVHGDLWSGNYMNTIENKPCVFDPAVYYGNREMDIAMMCLFGGFHSDTFKVYNEIFPLEKGWKERIDLCNLYPLLVHVNLFGGNYIKQVIQILNTYV